MKLGKANVFISSGLQSAGSNIRLYGLKIPPVAARGFDNADAVAMIRLPTPSIPFTI